MADDRIIIELDVESGQLNSSLNDLSNNASRQGRRIGATLESNIVGSIRRSLRSLIVQIGAVGSAFAAAFGFGRLTRDLISFEESLVEISSITNNLAISQEELNKTLITTAAQFGTSAQKQAQSFYQIISAGITDATEANDLLIAANQLAIGGLTDTSLAIDVLTTAVNALEKQNLSASKAADVLFGTVRLGKTRVDELSSSIGIVLPLANQLDVSFEEIGAAIADLTAKGIPSTAEAVTALRSLFVGLIRNQDMAAKKSRELGEAFSVQALRTKGLVGFLRDLQAATGGNESLLTDLIGRVEGVTAALTLSSDGFDGLENKVSELNNSLGASEDAFNKVFRTTSAQLSAALQNISNLFSALVGDTESIANALTSFNQAILDTINNIERFRARLVALTITAAGFFAVFQRGAIFTLISSGFSAISAQLAVVRLNFQLSRLSGSGFFTAIIDGFRASTLATKAFNVALRVTQGILTLGLAVVIQEILTRFLTLREALASTGDAFTFLGLQIQRGFLRAFREVIGFLAFEANPLFKALGVNLVSIFESTSRKIAEVNSRMREFVSTSRQASNELSTFGLDKDGNSIPQKVATDFNIGLSQITDSFTASFENMEAKQAAFTQESAKLSGIFQNAFINGISNSFAAFGSALASGGNAFEDFGKSIFKTLGGLAIQLGQFFILVGVGLTATASLLGISGAAAIAAGIGLTVFGGALQAMGGGDSGISAATATTGGADATTTQPPDLDVDEDLENLRETQVAVNIQGDVLDSRETGLRIVEILNESFDAEGTRLVTV